MCFLEEYELLINFLISLLTPITAIIMIWVAYQQMLSSRNSLKLSLYDRRFKVYERIKQLLAKVFLDAEISQGDLLDFMHDTNQSVFLLDDEGTKYIKSLYDKGRELAGASLMLYGPDKLPVGRERDLAASKKKECLDWFADQHEVSKQMFVKYLRLDDIK